MTCDINGGTSSKRTLLLHLGCKLAQVMTEKVIGEAMDLQVRAFRLSSWLPGPRRGNPTKIRPA